MLELLKHRRSIRTFTDEPVSQENIDSLLKAALLAPSSMGKKPVECIVVRNKETIARLKTYKKHGTTPLGTAPLAIVVIADGQKSDVWVEDASIVSRFHMDPASEARRRQRAFRRGFPAGAWHP